MVPKKVLVLGLGSIGMRHARNFAGLGCEVSGFDPTSERRQRFTDELGDNTFDDQSAAFDQGPDLVVVASPNIYHLSQATAAANRGFNLFVEKPLGTDLGDAQTFAKLARQNNIYVHMGSNWKFHPAFKTMKSIVSQGEIGRICGINVIAGQWLPDWHPWEDYRQMYAARKDLGGGAIFDTHELDYMTWLLGPVASFSGQKAHTGSLEIETEDVAGSVMTFENGAIGTLLTDYIQRVGQRSYMIIGDKGTLFWNIRTGKIHLSLPDQDLPKVINVQHDNINDMYIAQSAFILEDICHNRTPITGLDHMINILELQSAWHNQALNG